MSCLAGIPSGGFFDTTRFEASRCEETYEGLRARIMENLLPAQRAFVEDTTHKILGLCAGFGSGKTHALCAKAVVLSMDNPGKVGAVFEPTSIMLRDVWMRSFDEYLDSFGIEFDFRISPQPEYVLHLPNGKTTLICRATETFNRIRGQNLAFCLADEIDTSNADTAEKAAQMMLARLRGGDNPQLAVASTPEGFKWMYRTFVERPTPETHLIRARTQDNPHLPPGFIESLYANYPPQLLASYVDGQFTNLENTNVYGYFDREKHWTDAEIREQDRIYIGIDFNVGACFLEVCIRRGDEFHFVDEYYPKDTPAVVAKIEELYPDHIARGQVVVIPDASSRKRTSCNANESDLSLLKRGGFIVKNQLSNPEIADRVNAMNVLMLNDRMFVHPRCKFLIRSLETQAFDRNGKPDKTGTATDDKSGPVDAAGYLVHALAGLRRYQTGGSNFVFR